MRAHQGIAFRTAYVIARDAGDAEEAVQDGFVRPTGRWRGSGAAPFRPLDFAGLSPSSVVPRARPR